MALVEPGETLYLREHEYQFGTGNLTIKVMKIVDASDPVWVELEGVEIWWNGDQRFGRQVRVAREALRSPLTRQKR